MEARFCSRAFSSLLILFLVSIRRPVSTEYFFSFGPENEDDQLLDGNHVTESQLFPGPFLFYGQLYQRLSVSYDKEGYSLIHSASAYTHGR